MQNTLTPATSDVVELLKEAADQGRIVMVLLAQPTGQRHIDCALMAPPLRSDTGLSLIATCCVLFALTRAEGRALIQLVKQEHATKEELHAAISHDDDPATKIKGVDVVIHRLRRKLSPHAIKINNIYGQGFRLAEDARDKIRRLLAEYGEDIIAATTPPTAARGEVQKPQSPASTK